MYLIRERLFRLGQDSDITDEHGRPVLHVDGRVLSLRNRLDHEFTIGRGDQPVATVSKRWFTMGDTYAVEVASGQDDLLLLASVLALDLAEDQERRQH